MRSYCLAALALATLIPLVRGANAAPSLLYIGTRGSPPPAQSAADAPLSAASPAGIYAARFDSHSGKLTALGLQQPLRGATWLTVNPSLPILYSVGTPSGGPAAGSQLHTFAIDAASGSLKQLGEVPSGGHDTTYLYLDDKARTLFGASYAGGEVTAAPILADGSVGEAASIQKDVSDGPGPSPRQRSPHAHSVVLDPTGGFVLASDLGADRIFIYRFDPATRALAPAEPAFEPVSPGDGPRHLLFHPNGRFVYLNTELSARLYIYRWNPKAGQLQRLQDLSLYPEGFAGSSRSSSELVISHDGRFLYVGLRGDQNSVVVFALNGTTGAIREIQRISAQGEQPWALSIDPSGGWLAVANNGSNSVDVLRIDPHSGKLAATGERLTVPDAAALAFFGR